MKRVLKYISVLLIILNMFMPIIRVLAYEYIDPSNANEIDKLKDEIYQITEEYYELYRQDNNSSFNGIYSNKFWWPIGSAEVTEENGVLFAKGEPEAKLITSPYGERDLGQGVNRHSGVDLSGGSGEGNVNIIAAKSGIVVYPTDDSQTGYPRGGLGNFDGGGYGNFVVIQHSDGNYTLYGHLYQNSITVRAGDTVSQGQVIGKMGSSGNSTGTHLHFEIRIGQNTNSAAVDPMEYISADDPRPMGSAGGNFSVTETSLSKAEFITRMNDYAGRAASPNFRTTFADNAEMIYDVATSNGINPELVVVTAIAESSARYHSSNNYWGIGVTNGSSSGATYATFRDGVQGYCDVLKSYMSGGAARINRTAAEREAAGCDPAGYGSPESLAGQQSSYSWIGNYRFNPGDSSLGGCYYLNIIYGANYCSTVPTCSGSSGCSEESRTTVCEQNDYTAWQVNKKAQIRFDIFGV